jgi:hypothetical protein
MAIMNIFENRADQGTHSSAWTALAGLFFPLAGGPTFVRGGASTWLSDSIASAVVSSLDLPLKLAELSCLCSVTSAGVTVSGLGTGPVLGRALVVLMNLVLSFFLFI